MYISESPIFPGQLNAISIRVHVRLADIFRLTVLYETHCIINSMHPLVLVLESIYTCAFIYIYITVPGYNCTRVYN